MVAVETEGQIKLRREADAARKREERAAAKLVKEAAASQDELSAAETVQEFWAVSIRSADPVKLTEWKARQEYVEALLGDVRNCLEGDAPDAQFFEDVDEEIRNDIKEHGIAGVTVPLLIGQFWKQPETLAKLTSGGDTPSSIFARFGILTAVADYALYKWDTFYRRWKHPRIEIPEVFYVSLSCSICHAPPTAIPSAVAEAYNRTKKYVCGNCLEKAAKLRNFTQGQRALEHTIFDDLGRVLDQ